MSKKLILIVVGLFILQFGIFVLIEKEVKPEEKKKKALEDFADKYDIFLDMNGQLLNGHLYLGGRNLSEIPARIYTFKNVESINLSNNNLTKFPYELLDLPNLKTLNLSNNKIKNIDFSKVKFSSLQTLELQQNKITLVKKLENLNHLKSINLSLNELTELPNITNDALYFVRFNFNKIKKVKGKIGENLKVLNLIFNEISEFDLDIRGNEKLESLKLDNNYTLGEFPYEVLGFPHLKELHLNSCKIKSIEEQALATNQSLKTLNLDFNDLKEIKLNKSSLTNLAELSLANNKLEKIDIVHNNIRILTLKNNQLTHQNISLKMSNLSELDLTNNQLKDLPKSTIDAPNLEHLTIFDNLFPNSNLNKILDQFFPN